MSLVTAVQWSACFVIATFFLPLLNWMGAGNIFYLFACMCFLSILFCYYFVPETRGISLEQIENNLRNGFLSRDLGDENGELSELK